MRKIICLLLCSIVLFSYNTTACGGESSALTEEEKALFAWFDKLGFPDVTGCKYVRVTTGWWTKCGNEPPENRYINAFLLKEEDNTFTVFTNGLFEHTFKKTQKGTAEHLRVDFEVLDLKNSAKATLGAIGKSQQIESSGIEFGPHVGEYSEILVFARGCAKNGLEKLAHDLCVSVAKAPQRILINEDDITLKQFLAQQISHMMMWKAILKFEVPSITRKELLASFGQFMKNYPNSRHFARAKETAELLKQLIKEDEEHAAKKIKPFAEMTTEGKVAELIYQLRDQNGHQWSQPGSCDIFADPRKDKSPAHMLVEMGFDAIPQLIEVVNDKRFTRSVGYWRNFLFSHRVLRVGDAALAIIQRIAGRSFHIMTKDRQVSDTKKAIAAWWSEIQKKGEKNVLIEAVAAGDRNSTYQAYKLVEKYPEYALDAIIKGAKAAEKWWIRTRLIDIAAEIKGDSPVSFLQEESEKAPFLSCRVAAARGLLKRGHSSVVTAMIDEWVKLSSGKSKQERDAREALVEFLATCGNTDAIKALSKYLLKHTVGTRLSVISTFGKKGNMSYSGCCLDGGINPADWDAEKKEEWKAVETEVETLLITSLDDTEECVSAQGTWGNLSFTDPRICDIAAYILSQRWENKYKFDYSASLGSRNRQIIFLKNVWLKENNSSLLPTPQKKMIELTPDEIIKPLLKHVVESEKEKTRNKALLDIEKLGLAALPAVIEVLKGLDNAHSAKKNLDNLSKRLACIVECVSISKQSVPTDEAFKKLLEGMKGKPFTSKGCVDILRHVANRLPEGVEGIKLASNREGDYTGVTLEVCLIKGTATLSSGWETDKRVSIGAKCINRSGGYESNSYLRGREGFSDFIEAIDKALQSSPTQSFEIRVSVRVDRD